MTLSAVGKTALAILSLGLSGCAAASQAEDSATPRAETAVRVENQSFSDMTIYVVRGGQRVRLGMVPGNSTRLFFLQPSLVPGVTPLRFLADPIGSSRTALSHEVVVQPGDVIEMVIPSTVR